MNLKDFTTEVDQISKETYSLAYTEENGEDCKVLKSAWEDNETPQEFVDWWAEKYSLDTMDEFLAIPSLLRKSPVELKNYKLRK